MTQRSSSAAEVDAIIPEAPRRLPPAPRARPAPNSYAPAAPLPRAGHVPSVAPPLGPTPSPGQVPANLAPAGPMTTAIASPAPSATVIGVGAQRPSNVLPFVPPVTRAHTPSQSPTLAPVRPLRPSQMPIESAAVAAPPTQQADQAAASTQTFDMQGFGQPLPSIAPAPNVDPWTTPQAPVAPQPAAPSWGVYEKIGLGPDTQKKAPFNRSKFIVDTYRLLGFAILSIIVVVLVGYIATNVFYATSGRWVQPMVISSTDERVMSMAAKAAELETQRDKLASDLAQAERVIESQQAFQSQFAAAIRADLKERQLTLGKVKELAEQYAGASERSKRSNYAAASSARMNREYRAGLIDNAAMLSGNYQVAQIQTNTLSLAERQTEYETRATKLEAEAKALDGIVSGNASDVALSYDVLRIKQEFEASRLQTTKLIAERKNLQAALQRQEALLETTLASPFLRASRNNANIAFVPYDNLDKAKPGEPLYSCWLEMIICRKVGTVRAILPGEVHQKHPVRSGTLRGQMIEIDLKDRDAARKETLFVGRRPLLI